MNSAALNLALSIDSNIRRADPTTIKNKFLVGYQGWFNCHGDGEPVGPGHHGWIHWFTHPVPHGGTLNIDYWPETSQYSQEELFDAPGFKHKDGSPARLFSSRNPKTVQKHFHWMAENGVDGVFLQRFLGLCDIASGGNNGNRRIRDEVSDNVQRAAEREGRVYAIMYDVTGVQPERIQEIIEADWYHLLQEKRVLNSPNYLREDGKPVIAIWGLGLKDRNHTPAQVRALTSFFRNSTPGGAYLVAGTAAHWRTSDSDADPNPEFVNTWMESFDAISPWTVGRYSDQTSADAFAENRIQGDVMFIGKWAMTRGRRVDYLPVVHPGGSGFNMSNGHWARNGAPREGGRFLWRQIYNARKLGGARMMYGAMWDEYDEGTQFMPAIAKTADLPRDESHRFTLMAYDVDGYDVPLDWYMRIAGYGSALLKGERYIEDRFPEKDLRDWAPKYEERATLQSLLAGGSGSGSTSGRGQSSRDVLNIVEQTKGQDEVPPPPYSLTDDGSSSAKPVFSQGPEPPVLTRPDLVRQESRPPPPVPPRLDSRSSRPPYGVAPAVPLASRPRPLSTSPPRSPPVSLSPRPTPSLTGPRLTPPLTGPRPTPPLTSRPTPPLTSPPRSPAPLQHRPSLTAHHDQAPTSPYHTSAPQPAPMLSSYPGQHTQVQRPPSGHGHEYGHGPQYEHGPQRHDSGSSSFIAPTIQLPMPNIPSIPQPGDSWSPSLSAQPAWSHQDWKRPGPMPPALFPTPGPASSSYDYQSRYNEPYSFPEAARPADYGFPALHTPAILEPQQLNPGPPPPIHGRPRSTPPGHALDAPPPGRSSSARSSSPSHYDLKSRTAADKFSNSIPASNVGYPDGDRKRKDTLLHRIGSASAAGGKMLSKFTK